MTLGVLFVMCWFAVIAAYLVWQYATSALAGQDEVMYEAERLVAHPEPVVVHAPLTAGAGLLRVTAAT
jgi:hypothetical protein